jgi:hypothetical protein
MGSYAMRWDCQRWVENREAVRKTDLSLLLDFRRNQKRDRSRHECKTIADISSKNRSKSISILKKLSPHLGEALNDQFTLNFRGNSKCAGFGRLFQACRLVARKAYSRSLFSLDSRFRFTISTLRHRFRAVIVFRNKKPTLPARWSFLFRNDFCFSTNLVSDDRWKVRYLGNNSYQSHKWTERMEHLQGVPTLVSVSGKASAWVIFVSVPSRRDQT